MRIAGIVLVIVSIMAMAAVSVAEAGIGVTPERQVLTLSPGKSQTVEYKVYNSGPQEIDVEIDPRDWTGVDGTSKKDIPTWVSLPEKRFLVKVEETRPFKVTVNTPEGVDGEMLAMLFLCYKEDANSALNIRNGVPLYLIIKGTEEYKAEVDSVKLRYYEDPKSKGNYILNATAIINNSGNVHIQPYVNAILTDEKEGFAKKTGSGERRILLRTQGYSYQLMWPYCVLADGRYRLAVQVSYEEKIALMEKEVSFEIRDGELVMDKEADK